LVRGFAVASAGLSGVLLAFHLDLWAFWATEGRLTPSAFTRHLVDFATLFDLLFMAMSLALLIATAWWVRVSRELLRQYAGDDRALRRGALGPWWLLLVAGFVASVVGGNPDMGDDPAAEVVVSALRWLTLGDILRVVSTVGMLFGVWRVGKRIRRAIAESTLAPTSTAPPVSVVSLPPANDAFWARTAEIAVARRADLAVLEATWLVRRWSLLPADGSTATLRAAIAPDTVVTVFPEPPRPGDTAPTEVPDAPPGTDFLGFIEEERGTDRTFQLVPQHRVAMWLAEARRSARWGLYRSDDPGVLTAVMPQPAGVVDPTR
jgi:hypothetical protein